MFPQQAADGAATAAAEACRRPSLGGAEEEGVEEDVEEDVGVDVGVEDAGEDVDVGVGAAGAVGAVGAGEEEAGDVGEDVGEQREGRRCTLSRTGTRVFSLRVVERKMRL